MVTFRGIVLILALLILAWMWSSFFLFYEHSRTVFRTETKMFLYSVPVAITFLIIVRVWETWNKGKHHE